MLISGLAPTSMEAHGDFGTTFNNFLAIATEHDHLRPTAGSYRNVRDHGHRHHRAQPVRARHVRRTAQAERRRLPRRREGWQRLKDFVEDGGTLVALGDASKTATELLSLPVKNPLPAPSEDYFVPGSLITQKFDSSEPAAWGMPEEWPIWFNKSDAAFEVASGSGGDVTIAGSQVTYRTWSRATITMLFNAMYDGPAQKVDAIDEDTHPSRKLGEGFC
ncbi:MAG: hypothetical protein GEV11_09610 [Streptosporangiales bacterium]|nr:hypothetical protein [Streptosporangiales bacterium]